MTDKYEDRKRIEGQLDHLRSSAAFVRCKGLFGLLAYVVNETLDGRGDTLKELVIGDALYGRSTPYDPRIDSAVRVEAGRLRRKLAQHYAGPGRHDPVRIRLPTGSYLPIFESNGAASCRAVSDHAAGAGQGAMVDLAIMPFRALSDREPDDHFADGLTDQLIFALGRRSPLRLAPRLMVFQYKNRHYTVPEVVEKLGADVMLHGTYRRVGDRRRVTVELCDSQGFVTWSAQVDHDRAEDILLQEIFAGEIVSRMPPWIVGAAMRERGLVAIAS